MNELILYNIVTGTAGDIAPCKLKQALVLPYKSLVWEECYDTCGTLQCVVQRDDDILNKVHSGMLASFEAALTIMYIHSIKITDTEIWLYGYEAKALFEKKFAVTMMTQGMTKVNVLNTITQKVSSGGMRWLGGTTGEQIGDANGEANLGALEYNNMLEFITQCCKIDDCGFFVSKYTDPAYGWLYLSHGSSANKVLSPKLGNVSQITYTYTDKPRYNQVIAMGESSDGVPTFAMANRIDSDMPQGELYTYFMDLSAEFPQPEDVSAAEYYDALTTRAKISLGMRVPKETLEIGDVEQELEWGDIVTVKLPELGITAQKRVCSVTYTVEGGVMTKKYKLRKV